MVGLVSKSTVFTGQPLNSDLALVSNAGSRISKTWFSVNLSIAFFAAPRSLKANGTNPSMYCVESFDTSTHSNFWAAMVSPRALMGYSIIFGAMTRTYHFANLPVVLFMFFNVSRFFGNIVADRVWPQSKRS